MTAIALSGPAGCARGRPVARGDGRRRQGATGRGAQEGVDEGLTTSRVVYASEASDQLFHLYGYVAEHSSPTIAQRYIDAVIATCEGLALFPHRGVARDDIRPGLRLTHHKGRTIIAYAVDDDTRQT